jgi:hypothetical protein
MVISTWCALHCEPASVLLCWPAVGLPVCCPTAYLVWAIGDWDQHSVLHFSLGGCWLLRVVLGSHYHTVWRLLLCP